MVTTYNERPVCFCEREECPAGCPIAFAPLDVRFPPTFCKFCSTRFNYDESDVHPPPRKGLGKGDYDYGKGTGKSNKGNGKGKGGYSRSQSPPRQKRQQSNHDANPKAPSVDVANTMNWLATLGLAPELCCTLPKQLRGREVAMV